MELTDSGSSKYSFGNVGIKSTADAGYYVRAGGTLNLPISVEPTEGLHLDDPKKPDYWKVFSGRLLTPEEIQGLESEVTRLVQEETKPKV